MLVTRYHHNIYLSIATSNTLSIYLYWTLIKDHLMTTSIFFFLGTLNLIWHFHFKQNQPAILWHYMNSKWDDISSLKSQNHMYIIIMKNLSNAHPTYGRVNLAKCYYHTQLLSITYINKWPYNTSLMIDWDLALHFHTNYY